MLTNISSKALALGGITVLIAGAIAIVNTISQGYLFEIKKATAALEEAKASHESAKAQLVDAENKLKGTENTAVATVTAAQLEATATKIAAQHNAQAIVAAAERQAQGLIRATEESVHAENTMFDDLTGPMLTGPAKRMAEINEEIVRLQHEVQTGINSQTRQFLSPAEIAERTSRRLRHEEELAMLKETTSKNWSDAFGMMTQFTNGMIADLGGLYSAPAGSAPSARRIVSER